MDPKTRYKQFQRKSALLALLAIAPLLALPVASWFVDVRALAFVEGTIVAIALTTVIVGPMVRLASEYYQAMPLRPDGTPFDKDAPSVTRSEVALHERTVALMRRPLVRLVPLLAFVTLLVLLLVASLFGARAEILIGLFAAGIASGIAILMLWCGGPFVERRGRESGQSLRWWRWFAIACRTTAILTGIAFVALAGYGASVWLSFGTVLAAGALAGAYATRSFIHWYEVNLWPA